MRREVIRKYVEKYSLGLIDVNNSLEEYEKFYKNMGFSESIKELVHEKITAQGRAVVMDIGCGNAGFLLDLKEIFKEKVETIGVDLLVPMKKPDKVVAGDVLDLELPKNVDFVFSFRALHEIGEPQKITEKIYASLAPKGRAFLSFRTMDLYVDSKGIAEIGQAEIKQLTQMVRRGKLLDFSVKGFEVSLKDEKGKKFTAGVNVFLAK